MNVIILTKVSQVSTGLRRIPALHVGHQATLHIQLPHGPTRARPMLGHGNLREAELLGVSTSPTWIRAVPRLYFLYRLVQSAAACVRSVGVLTPPIRW